MQQYVKLYRYTSTISQLESYACNLVPIGEKNNVKKLYVYMIVFPAFFNATLGKINAPQILFQADREEVALYFWAIGLCQ